MSLYSFKMSLVAVASWHVVLWQNHGREGNSSGLLQSIELINRQSFHHSFTPGDRNDYRLRIWEGILYGLSELWHTCDKPEKVRSYMSLIFPPNKSFSRSILNPISRSRIHSIWATYLTCKDYGILSVVDLDSFLRASGCMCSPNFNVAPES